MKNKFIGSQLVEHDYEKWPTIPEQFLLACQAFPQNICYASYNPKKVELTFEQVKDKVEKVATYLQNQQIKKGDKVILIGKNSINWAISYVAISFSGATIIPLDVQMDINRVRSLIELTEANFIIGDSNILEHLNSNLPNLSLTDDTIDSLTEKKEKTLVESDQNDIAAILFTSGTTGNEKGVILTHKNLISDAHIAADKRFLNFCEKDVLYALLPLHHSYCMTAVFLEGMVFGCKIVFGSGIVVSRMLKDLKDGKITGFMGIPLLFNKIYNALNRKIREKGILKYAFVALLLRFHAFLRKVFKINLRNKWFKFLVEPIGMSHNNFCICGGGPLAPKTVKRYYRMGIDFVQGYGLTETSPIMALNPVSKFKVRSVGKVLPLLDVKIIDKNEFGIGEIVVKGPTITSGYFKNEEETKNLFTEDGYLKTGDLGYLDKENYLYIKGRSKNIIVTEGGKNIYPEEIEDAFQFEDKVEQVLIRGYYKGGFREKYEDIEAVIYPASDQIKSTNKEDIYNEIKTVVENVNRTLKSYQKITKITVTDKPMPTTGTRKIKRNKVEV